MKTIGRQMGEFPLAHIGVFDFRGSDFAADSSYFGLHLNEAYLIAHVVSKRDGRMIHFVRPMMLYTSSGAALSAARADGGVYQDERTAQFLRGGTFTRSITDSGAMRLSGSSGFWSGGVHLTVDATFGDQVSWQDSGHVSLTGRILGPAMQTYVPSRRGHAGVGVCHTGTFYEADGQIFDEAVSGIVAIEHVFSPPAEILADSSIRRRFGGGWNGFASVFEDDSKQHGHIAFGTGPFRFANIMDGDRHICCAIESIATATDANGLGRRIEYRLANGELWEFVTQATLMDYLTQARAAGSSTQVHKGYVGRVGETRKRRNAYSIQEWVPERLRNDAVESNDIVPRGF